MIDYLLIGHLARDVVPGGTTVGGTTAYSSIAARNLGRKPGIVTRFSGDFVLPPILHDVEIHNIPSRHTTTFHNIYAAGRRKQHLLSLAGAIRPEDIPQQWRHPRIVHLAPLARELDNRCASMFPHALVCVTPQGWLRQWDEAGLVSPRPWEEASEILPHVDVVVFSEEDLPGNHSLIRDYAARTEIAVMTLGPLGCDVFAGGKQQHIPGFPVREVDPTGAGDVFAAAFAIRYQETCDPFEAARFANAAASFCVEAPGAAGIPARSRVEQRIRESAI